MTVAMTFAFNHQPVDPRIVQGVIKSEAKHAEEIAAAEAIRQQARIDLGRVDYGHDPRWSVICHAYDKAHWLADARKAAREHFLVTLVDGRPPLDGFKRPVVANTQWWWPRDQGDEQIALHQAIVHRGREWAERHGNKPLPDTTAHPPKLTTKQEWFGGLQAKYLDRLARAAAVADGLTFDGGF